MLPSICAERAIYAGVSAARLKLDSVRAGVGGAPISVGAREDTTDSARDISVTGGGLQISKMGSSDMLRSCLVFSGAMMAHVVMLL